MVWVEGEVMREEEMEATGKCKVCGSPTFDFNVSHTCSDDCYRKADTQARRMKREYIRLEGLFENTLTEDEFYALSDSGQFDTALAIWLSKQKPL